MMYREDRLVVLVTGASRGIGRAVATELATAGHAVAIGARDPDAGQAVATDLGPPTVAVRLDVTEGGAPARAIEQVVEAFGRLDVLVNNAGRIVEAAPLDVTADVLAEVFATNVYGAAEMIRAAVPHLRRSAHPRIVNVSSTTASLQLTAAGTDFGGDAARWLAYSTSKAALNMLTLQYHRAFAADPGLRHILIDSATPGFTATDMNAHAGTRSVGEGARVIIDLATAPDDGPSGAFVNDQGPVAW